MDAEARKNDEYAYGCLFCRSGCEERIAREIKKACPEILTIVPQKMIYLRMHGVLRESTEVLFPGYIFFRVMDDFYVDQLFQCQRSCKLLTDSEGLWKLHSDDRLLVEELFRCGGTIGISQVYYVNDKIKPIKGLLKDYEGKIIRVNHRNKKAQVEFQIGNINVTSWLGYEEVVK